MVLYGRAIAQRIKGTLGTMALVVQTGTMLLVAVIGALAMWQQGIALADVRAAGVNESVRGQ